MKWYQDHKERISLVRREEYHWFEVGICSEVEGKWDGREEKGENSSKGFYTGDW